MHAVRVQRALPRSAAVLQLVIQWSLLNLATCVPGPPGDCVGPRGHREILALVFVSLAGACTAGKGAAQQGRGGVTGGQAGPQAGGAGGVQGAGGPLAGP